MACRASQGQRETKESLVQADYQVNQAELHQDLRVRKENQELLELMVVQGLKEMTVILVLTVFQAEKVNQVVQGFLAAKEIQDRRASEAHQACQAVMGCQAPQDKMEFQQLKENEVVLAYLVLKEHQAKMVLQAYQVKMELRVSKEIRDFQV